MQIGSGRPGWVVALLGVFVALAVLGALMGAHTPFLVLVVGYLGLALFAFYVFGTDRTRQSIQRDRTN